MEFEGRSWLSTTEVAALFGVNGETIRRWAREGRIPSWRTPGGTTRFDRTALEPYLPKIAGEASA